MLSITAMTKMIDERGPRYAVSAQIRGGEWAATYATTSEQAERARERYEDEWGYRNAKVHVPDLPGMDIDLAGYGRARLAAQKAFNEATEILKAAVTRAAETGRDEAEIARTAQVDRMTVRAWLGKPKRGDEVTGTPYYAPEDGTITGKYCPRTDFLDATPPTDAAWIDDGTPQGPWMVRADSVKLTNR